MYLRRISDLILILPVSVIADAGNSRLRLSDLTVDRVLQAEDDWIQVTVLQD